MSLLADASRYWHTLRHLRPIQIYGRMWFRLARPSPDRSPAPSLREVTGDWVRPARRRPILIGPDEFLLLNRALRLEDAGWDNPDVAKLWRYHQHYFDDLNASNPEARQDWHRSLIDRWILENPPAIGTGWEPYPTALRIVNWIKWASSGNDLQSTITDSLATQVRWLLRRLEWHLLGNHLFSDAKALVFAGTYFDGAEADRWFAKGAAILARQIDEQILADGGHFELSPMYHALAFEDVLDLVNIMRRYRGALRPAGLALLAKCEGRLAAMGSWLCAMSHPDGDVALFNDAASGIAPPLAELVDYAARMGTVIQAGLPDLWLSECGYARLSRGRAVLIVDMACVGPDYLPGHAHADTLSCEFSLGHHRILVNGGTSLYETGHERLRQRGTAAHNSVVVAGRNSSEVWAGFRVARRARPLGVRVSEVGTELCATASHDGYYRLPGRPRHSRKWELSASRLRIQDVVAPSGQDAVAIYHFHPAVAVEIDGADRARLQLPDGQKIGLHWEGGEASLADGTWHPEFGRSVANVHLRLPLREGSAAIELRWD